MKHFASVLLFAATTWGQVPGAAPAQDAGTAATTNAPTQRVGPDDLLSVSVADCPELTRSFRVRGDGTMALPLIKAPIAAKGKYPHEIEAEIAGALVREQLLVQPVVSVSVSEYRSIPVSVLGAVRHPITFQAAGEVTLLDALTRADGLSSDAGGEILISRTRAQADADGTGLIQRIPVKGLIDDADPTLDIRLHGGEEIRVPAAGRVYVIGNVKKTGAFPIQDGTDTTVLKLIALTEGVLPYTNKDAYIYRREAGRNSRNEIVVPLQQIMRHKAPDVSLEANDILYVPDSSGRRVSAETIKVLTGFGISTASGLLIWR
jgi:polysaccharide export outer membrane protein